MATRFVTPSQFSTEISTNSQVCLMGKLTESNGDWKIGNIRLNDSNHGIEKGDNQFAQAWVEKTGDNSAKILKPIGVINCDMESVDMDTLGKYLGKCKQDF